MVSRNETDIHNAPLSLIVEVAIFLPAACRAEFCNCATSFKPSEVHGMGQTRLQTEHPVGFVLLLEAALTSWGKSRELNVTVIEYDPLMCFPRRTLPLLLADVFPGFINMSNAHNPAFAHPRRNTRLCVIY